MAYTLQISQRATRSLGLTVAIGVLWLGVLVSAIAVVYASHDARLKLNTLENLRREEVQLQVVWGQYLLEESAWSSYGRVEKLAAERLSMAVPLSSEIIAVNPDES